MNILKKANEIVNERSEEKKRQYGPFIESMRRATAIYNNISKNKIEVEDMYKVMVALKLSREAYSHKEDNLLDAVAYIGALNNFYNTECIDASLCEYCTTFDCENCNNCKLINE